MQIGVGAALRCGCQKFMIHYKAECFSFCETKVPTVGAVLLSSRTYHDFPFGVISAV